MSDFVFGPGNVWLIAIGFCCTTISVLLACICGCRKGTPKNELLGVDGMMKLTNPDENVNHLPSVVGNYVSQSYGEPVNGSDSDDQSKRPSGGSNPHRSLPDIPICTEGEIRISSDNGVSGGDTSSELYATVDDKTLTNILYNKRHTLPNGIDTGPSLSHQSSLSQSDSNYARLKENPYDKVKKNEHPYANVQSTKNNKQQEPEETLREHSPIQNCDVTDKATTSECSRPNSVNSNVLETSVNIPAAPAVAGRVAASQELPYMTPPIAQPQQQQPQYFSGDSQDSSRGYTSISVREPLANIINQTSAIRNRKADLDPHYSTVSDDSDEMYAAIADPNSSIYTSSSETYAQIQPVTTAVAVAEIHEQPVNISASTFNVDGQRENEDQYESTATPQPPSVDSLKHVAHVHSRQASSSSCTSSVANIGSPKPEKRQANSPLPPPPAASPDLYNRIDKEEDNNTTVVRNLEDMYAKVHKNKKKSDDEKLNDTSEEVVENSILVHNNNNDNAETNSNHLHEHCYETLNKFGKKQRNWLETSGPESLSSNDPGYEQLRNRAPSENDPNYEILRPHRTETENDNGINTTNDKSTLTIPDDSFDDNYATIHQKSTESESDPNYESVKYLDVTVSEPPYERLNEDETKGSSDLSEYEQISSGARSKSPGYERIGGENASKSSDSDIHSDYSNNSKEAQTEQKRTTIENDVFHV